jgi:glyoxylase-like metal-dependent hydrolase (beta-lactamase superfamily II)
MFRCEEIVPGVLRLLMARRCFGRDLYPTACYVIPDAGLMVDSGSAIFAGHTLNVAKASKVQSVILTHSHEDHTGGAATIISSLRADCFAHNGALQTLSNPRSLRMPPYRKFMFGTPIATNAMAPPELFHRQGMQFRIIDTPGHSPDHMVVFEEKRGWLFGGDVFIPVPERVFFRVGCNYAQWVKTLRKMADLHPERLFTGMGPMKRNPSRFLKQKADRLTEISEKVMSLHGQGWKDHEIAKKIFPGDLMVRMITSGEYSAVNIVRACLESPVCMAEPDAKNQEDNNYPTTAGSTTL